MLDDYRITAPFQQETGSGLFPECFQGPAEGDIPHWIGAHQAALTECLHQSGALLLRDFGLRTAEDFDAAVAAFGWPGFTYGESLSNAVRVNMTPRVFTANEAPPSVSIAFHHELAQTPHYPRYLFFFCETAAEQGGATPLVRSDRVLDRLAEAVPDFVEGLRRRGVCYSIIMPGVDDPQAGQGRSWTSTLGVDTRPQAEARLAALGYGWRWLDGEALLTTSPVLPAIKRGSNGRDAFFNQLIAAHLGWPDLTHVGAHKLAYGDGTPLPPDALDQAADITESLAVDLPWQPGDMAVVDNSLVMHGRRPFSGARRVLASFAHAP